MEWGGDDWGSFGSGHEKTRKDEDRLLSSTKTECMKDFAAAAAGTEVKIKVSKKELERLLKEADVEGRSLQQVLAQLMGAGEGDGDGFEAHRRSWRPALNSIPE